MEETTTGGATEGRLMHVRAFGDTADELELNAIDQAREFFGPDVRLTIVRDYVVGTVKESDWSELRKPGKRFWSEVSVRAGE